MQMSTETQLPLDVANFEFIEGGPDSTRATLQIKAGGQSLNFCLDRVQLELLGVMANKAAAMLDRP